MAVITTYSGLLTTVADYLARSDLADYLPNFVQNWEAKFYREPENHGPWMERPIDALMTSGRVAVPSDYLALKRLAIYGRRPLDRVSSNQLYSRYPVDCGPGMPFLVARDGSQFLFGPSPDSDYRVVGVYWAKQTPLRSSPDDAADSWIIQNAHDLPLYGALLEAQPFLMNDKRLPVWGALYEAALRAYRDMIREEDISGSAPQEFLA